MNFQQYIARQLSHPTGLVGKFVLGPLWNRRNAALNEAAFTHLALKTDDRVLDIGFGGGYLLGKIISTVKGGFVAGIDVSSEMAENFRTRYWEEIDAGRLDIQCGRAESLPYPDGTFTKVSSVNSIFYWDDAEKGISEIYRVLDDGGMLVLTFTCKEDLGSKGFARHGVKTFEGDQVQEMLERVGFGDVQKVRGQDQHREFLCVMGWK
jgi:ubiquinone/menaquinone biosynthesis C-methylase UbiE